MSEAQRVAIITGASGGIGTAVAERLARDGLVVVVNYRGEAGPAEALVSTIEGAGGQAMAYKADVSEPGAVSAMFDAATEGFGSVDVLVNNAGLMKLAPGPAEAFTPDQLAQLYDVNVLGTQRAGTQLSHQHAEVGVRSSL